MAPPPSPHARLPPTISGIDERCLIVDFTDLVPGLGRRPVRRLRLPQGWADQISPDR